MGRHCLANASETFQRLMNEVFREHLGKFVLIYLDDIMIFSNGPEEHMKHLKLVPQKLREHRLYAKPSKCFFGQKYIPWLGHIVSKDGVRPDPDKTKIIAERPRPTTVKEVQAFLGFATWFRQYMQGYSQRTYPPTQLTRKSQPWKWTDSCEQAFQWIKDTMQKAPVLAHPDFTRPFEVCHLKWSEYLARFNIEWEYIAGHTNMADVLSRKPCLSLYVTTRSQAHRATDAGADPSGDAPAGSPTSPKSNQKVERGLRDEGPEAASPTSPRVERDDARVLDEPTTLSEGTERPGQKQRAAADTNDTGEQVLDERVRANEDKFLQQVRDVYRNYPLLKTKNFRRKIICRDGL